MVTSFRSNEMLFKKWYNFFCWLQTLNGLSILFEGKKKKYALGFLYFKMQYKLHRLIFRFCYQFCIDSIHNFCVFFFRLQKKENWTQDLMRQSGTRSSGFSISHDEQQLKKSYIWIVWSTIIWAAPRISNDIQEVKIISDILTSKYGKNYADSCKTDALKSVNEKVSIMFFVPPHPSLKSPLCHHHHHPLWLPNYACKTYVFTFSGEKKAWHRTTAKASCRTIFDWNRQKLQYSLLPRSRCNVGT